MEKRIYLSPPHLTDKALVYLQDAISSNWVAPVGPHVDAFQGELSSLLGIDHVLATNSCTSSIHLALLALGVGKGDEVLCSTFTFCASANPIIYCGASPIFVDSDDETWNIDPRLLEQAIVDRIAKTKTKPKAIIVVHLYGMPASMAEILEISERYEIPVLEDAAEALGSLYHQQQVGTFGAAGMLSFNGNKIITASAGGALFSSNAVIIEQARYFREEAREPLPHYEHKNVGFNYRMSNLLAAIGRSQLLVLNERVCKRRRIFEGYQEALNSLSFVRFQPEAAGSISNRWLSCILLDKRHRKTPEDIRLALEKENIESRPLWKPMHLQPVFKEAPYYGNGVSESLFERGLCLPSGSNLSEDDLGRVVEVVRSVLQ